MARVYIFSVELKSPSRFIVERGFFLFVKT